MRTRWAATNGVAAAVVMACGGAPEPAPAATSAREAPRSTVTPAKSDPGLPEARPRPFEVELRRRNGSESRLVRVTDAGVRIVLGRDPHDVTIVQPADAALLDALYATLREHEFHKIDGRPNADADTDGTSIRLLAGRRRHSATRMGHFEPAPEFAEHYDACVAAIEALAHDAGDSEGVALTVRFDESMQQRHASVEVDLDGDLTGMATSPELTIFVAKAREVPVRLRFGPPATEISATVDLSQLGSVTVGVDAVKGMPAMTFGARAPTTERAQ